MGMIASSPWLVIMVIIGIGNVIVMLLDFLLPGTPHVKTSRIPETNAPTWTN
jgi:hypothetical protein